MKHIMPLATVTAATFLFVACECPAPSEPKAVDAPKAVEAPKPDAAEATATAPVVEIIKKADAPKTAIPQPIGFTNLSFDTPDPKDPTMPLNWQERYAELKGPNAKHELVEGRDGKGKAIRLQGSMSHIAQTIRGAALMPYLGKKAYVSLWAKGADVESKPFMRLEYGKPNGDGVSQNIGKWNEFSTNWTEFESTIDIPTTATFLTIDLASKISSPTLANLYDDVFIEPIDTLLNPSFDKVDPKDSSLPAYWQERHAKFKGANAKHELVEGKDGKGKAVRLQGATCHIAQTVRGNALKPYLGKKTRVSVWAKGNAKESKPFMRLEFSDGNSSFDRNIGNWTKLTTDWNKFESVIDVPTTATMMIVDLASKDADPNLALYYDNVTLEVLKDKQTPKHTEVKKDDKVTSQ